MIRTTQKRWEPSDIAGACTCCMCVCERERERERERDQVAD